MVTSRFVNCYVLIGGRSTRMGQSKVTMFLDRVLAAAQPVFDEVIAVDRSGGQALAIRTLFEEEHADEGPVFGVLRALEDAPDRCFILAVDYPLISADVLRALRDRVQSSPAPIVVPVREGRPQPLCAGYAPEIAPLLRQRIRQSKLDLMGLIGEAGGETFTLDVPELANVNTPLELEEAERLR